MSSQNLHADPPDAPPGPNAPPGPMEPSEAPGVPPPGPHVARAGRYFRNVRYIIFIAAFGAGLWFLYDGMVKYPAQRERFGELTRQAQVAQEAGNEQEASRLNELIRDEGLKDHSDADILLQRSLGFVLPSLAVLLLIRWLYISRGEVRLDEDDTLHVPGHPPMPASSVREIDDALWDRKGISYIEFETPGGNQTVKLDDFVYERPPIDAIHDRLAYLHRQQSAGAA